MQPKNFYFEQKNFSGGWVPAASSERPYPTRADGSKIAIRNVQAIPDDYRFASLDELYDLFNPVAAEVA